MFTFSIRMILVAATACVGAYRLSSGNQDGAMLLVASGLLVYGHFRYGTVWLAYRAARAGKFERAGQLLSQISRPSILSSQMRAYYEFVHGAVAANSDRNEQAEQHFRNALQFKLRTDNDRCVVEINLAELLAQRGALDEARELVASARTRHCNPQVAAIVETVAESVGRRAP